MQNIRIGSTSGAIESGFGYDDNGSLLTETGPRAKTITWDPRNRPSTINADTFQYDPSGYRIQKTDRQGNRTYLLEGEHLEAIYSGTSPVATYFRGSVIDEIVNGYQLDASGKLINYTYHHDALQSVLGQSGHEGSILTTQIYGAFGSLQVSTGNTGNRLKYTVREEDGDTGLYYYRARYYDPTLGRFISEDPKGFEAGVNFYAYGGNNPVNANDPSGLAGIPGGAKAWFVSQFGHMITHNHHMVPTEVLKSLPAEVANNPAVRGVAGAPNKWPIPQDLHRTIHNTTEIGGQRYNEAFKVAVREIEVKYDSRSMTEIAAAEGMDLGRASRIARLARLAPSVVKT